jgi:hypothetical protein
MAKIKWTSLSNYNYFMSKHKHLSLYLNNVYFWNKQLITLLIFWILLLPRIICHFHFRALSLKLVHKKYLFIYHAMVADFSIRSGTILFMHSKSIYSNQPSEWNSESTQNAQIQVSFNIIKLFKLLISEILFL